MAYAEIPEHTKAKLEKGFHLQILFKNQIGDWTEPKATISSQTLTKSPTGGPDVQLTTITLKQLRATLAGTMDAKWSFCLENCAPVDDSSLLLYYLTLPKSNAEVLQGPAAGANPPPEAAVLPMLSVYMAVGSPMTPARKPFDMDWVQNHNARANLTMSTLEAFAIPGVPASYGAKYASEVAWTSAAGALDCVVDLDDANWAKLMLVSRALYAFDVRGKRLEVVGARLPAFELKAAEEEMKLPASTEIKSPDGKTTLPAPSVYIREFVELCDTPNIIITEVNSEFQSSLLDVGFSSRSLDAMVGGATPMLSASVSAGISTVSSKGSGSNEGAEKKEYHATYNFPRVKLFLDHHSLKVTKPCRDALLALKATPTLDNLVEFQRRFGVIFSSEVTLGGRLETTKSASSNFNAENSSAKEALKASLGAAVAYSGFVASADASSESQTKADKGMHKVAGHSTITYTARGGNTLLCANPAAWAMTVGVWKDWRVIQQDQPIPLQTLLGRFEGFEFVPGLFSEILPKAPVEAVAEPVKIFPSELKWTNKMRLRFWIGDKAFPSENQSYSVRDGNPKYEQAGPRQTLLADYPLLLFLGDALEFPGRDACTVYVKRDDGTLGPQTDKRSTARFTIRRAGSTGRWKPKDGESIINGEKVSLWCHSVGVGGWRKLEEPPSNASQAYWNSSMKRLEFDTKDLVHSPVGGYKAAEFVIEFVEN